jgi:MFS family permease
VPLPIEKARSSGRLMAVIVCATVLLVGTAVSLPVPMYAEYARVSGAGSKALGIAFACYAFGVLPSLLFLGGVSDRTGRRLPLVVALCLSIAAITAMSVVPGLPALAVARIAQGLAAGLTGASATALLAESFSDALASERAAACVTSMLAVGYALGGLATGACLLTGPTLFPLSYPMTLIACGIVTVMLLKQPYLVQRRQTELLRLPYLPAGGGWICVVIGAAWSLVGMILSIVPYELSHLGHPGWSGLIAFLMPLAGLAAQPARKRLSPNAAVSLGLVLAPVGCLLLLVGVGRGRLEPILLGAAFSGAAAVGFSFYGGLALIAELSGQEKARGAAAFFLACYVGMCGAPVVLGWIAERATTVTALAILSIALCGVSLGVWALSQMRRRASHVASGTASSVERGVI